MNDSESESYLLLEDPPNKDKFVNDVYSYYYGRGYYKIIITELFSILSFIFIVFFTIFVVTWVNYPIRSPSDPDYVSFFTPRINWFTIVCVVISSFILSLKWYRFIYDILKYRRIRFFFNEKLGINDYQLVSIRWADVVDLLNEKTGMGLSSLDVANIIMRKQNFMLALFNEGIINTSLPFTNYKVYNTTLDWYLQICVIDFIFDGRNIRNSFASTHTYAEELLSASLKKRFIIAGVVHLLSLPLTILHTIMKSIFEYGEMYYSDPKELGSREWTCYAKYKLREYNELEHIFDSRMYVSGEYAKKYIKQFPSPHIVPIFNFVTMVATAGILYILLLMFFTTHATEITMFGKTLLEYFSILGVVFLVARGVASGYEETKIYNPRKYMTKLAKFMHYVPEQWINDADKKETLSKLTSFYSYQLVILFSELAGVITAPFILIFSSPKSASHIVSFIIRNNTMVDNAVVGCICSYANFNRKIDEKNVEEKMQKSIINFRTNNPQWSTSVQEDNEYLVESFKGKKCNDVGIVKKDVEDSLFV